MNPALVLLDLQKGILLGDRIKFDDPTAPQRTLAAARALLLEARAARIPVIHVGVVRPHARGAFDLVRTTTASRSGRAPRDVLGLAAGSDDIAFLLEPAVDEEIVYKIGVSAFQGTRLDQLLRNVAATHVLAAGAFTHMVVESTVRQGFDLGYRMIVVEDACCSPSVEAHAAALAMGIPNFATVVRSAESAELFRGGRERDTHRGTEQ